MALLQRLLNVEMMRGFMDRTVEKVWIFLVLEDKSLPARRW